MQIYHKTCIINFNKAFLLQNLHYYNLIMQNIANYVIFSNNSQITPQNPPNCVNICTFFQTFVFPDELKVLSNLPDDVEVLLNSMLNVRKTLGLVKERETLGPTVLVSPFP